MTQKYDPLSPGDRFGHWVLLRRERNYAFKRKPWRWLARCDCGKEKLIADQTLRTGQSTSCGCAPRGPRLHKRTFANVAVLRVLNKYKRTAAERGYEWAIDNHVFEAIIAYPCSYCGAPPSNRTTHRGCVIEYSGIDRIDNTIGYFPGNVIPCCHQCTWAKKDRDLSDFVCWAKRVVETTAKLKIEEPA